MAKVAQCNHTTDNPLFDKMCEKFQFNHVAVAEVMLKKAERLHIRKTHISSARAEKKAYNFTFSPNFIRHASICCSILLLVSVLMICAIFGTSSNSQFSKNSEFFANVQQNVEPANADDSVNMASYNKDNAEIILQSYHEISASNIDSNTAQN